MSESDQPSQGEWPPFIGEFIKGRREALGMSQARLASLAKTTQQTVDRIESGKTRHSRAAQKILQVLDVYEEPILMGSAVKPAAQALDLNKAAIQPKSPLSDHWTPVFSIYFQGAMADLDEPSSFINTPEPLINVRGGYAVIMAARGMEPVIRRGDTVLLNPHIPPRAQQEVMLIGGGRARFGTLIDDTDTEWVIQTWSPQTAIERVPREEWPKCHVVVGKFNAM